VQAVDPGQDVTGRHERDEAAQKGDHGGEGGAPAAVQPLFLVGRAMPLAAGGAMVVGAPVTGEAVDGADVVAAVLDEAGVGLAVGADGAGAYVALFPRSSRAACWVAAASCWPRSRA
jgi:hypothetical protein